MQVSPELALKFEFDIDIEEPGQVSDVSRGLGIDDLCRPAPAAENLETCPRP